MFNYKQIIFICHFLNENLSVNVVLVTLKLKQFSLKLILILFYIIDNLLKKLKSVFEIEIIKIIFVFKHFVNLV